MRSFGLDAGNSLAVGVARTLAHLPYYSAAMSVEEDHGWITYRSRRTTPEAPRAELSCRYRPCGGVLPPVPGALEYFLTERYCLYTEDKADNAYRLET